ncbi:MAG: zinc ribbon domain-containing protein [Candidatus Eisenbacteria bacterium]|nr:zinc ribbon domain-containing protein [Candidatus Eisenbacteria bacterium]
MPTYEYECDACGLRFELKQSMKDAPLTECPECHGKVRRLVSGGAGFILKGSGRGRATGSGDACSLREFGRTCCGRDERCEEPPCGDTT